MFKKFLMAVMACVVLGPAHATLTFRLTDTGSSVVLSATGTVNTASLTPTFPGFCGSGTGVVHASTGQFCTGAGTAIRHAGLSGPTSFGPGALFQGTGASVGDNVYMIGALGELYLPAGYVSGTALSGSSTFPGVALADMGVTPGVYTWTFGSGATADTVVFVVGAPPAMVPALGDTTLALLAALLLLGSVPMLRRRS